MKYSLTKIAQELGLSKATVSLILSGRAREMRISEELEQKVNYVPNIHARRMNQKYVKIVGLLIDRSVKADSDNPFSDPNISGTDMKTYKGLQHPEQCWYPLVPGYETAGKVVAAGSEVDGKLKVGDRVMINECRKYGF